MGETLFNQFADESALESQRDFFINQILKPIKDGIKGLNVNIGTIDSSQSKKNVDQLSHAIDVLTTELNNVQNTMLGMSKTMRDFIESSAGATKAQKDAAKATLDSVKAQKELASAGLLQAKTDTEIAKAAKLKAQATKDSSKSQQAEQKAVEDAANDYLQLAKAYNEAALKAKNYVLRLGENHPIAVQAVKDANDMANILKKLDASVGQNQRNVGNYAGAMQGLGFSFTQVARELPSLAVNFQQFALAISNNLPYVADNLVQVKKQLAALKAEGKAVPSLFSAIASSILTWQVALAGAITVFTVYAKEIGKFFSELFDGSTAFSRAQKELAKTMAEVNVAGADQAGQLMALYKVTQDTNEQMDDRIDATNRILEVTDDINKATGESIRLTKDENGVLEENTEQWGKLVAVLIRVEKTKAILSSIGEAFKKVIAKQNESLGSQTSAFSDFFTRFTLNPTTIAVDSAGHPITGKEGVKARQQRVKQEGIDEAQAYFDGLEKRLLEGLKTGEFDLSGVFDANGATNEIERVYTLLTGKLRTLRDDQLQIANDENRFIADRLAAKEKAFNIEKTLRQLTADFEIAQARRSAEAQIKEQKGNAENIKTIQANLYDKIAKIRDDAGYEDRDAKRQKDAEELKLKEEFYQRLVATVARGEKQVAEAKKSFFDQRLKDAEAEFEGQKLLVNQFAEQETKIIRAAYKRGVAQAGDSVKGRIEAEGIYNEKRKELDRDIKKYLIQAELDYTKALLNEAKLRNAPEVEIKKIEAAIHKLQGAIDDLDFAKWDEFEQKVKSLKLRIDDALQSLRQLFVDTIKQGAANVYDQQIQSIDALIQKNNDLKDASVKRIQAEQISEQDKAAKIQILNAETERKNNQLEARKRSIETKKAQFEKAAALFQIGLDLSRSVNKIKLEALATPNPVLKGLLLAQLPIAYASALLQAAVVASKPIPKYAKGTQSSPEGVAEVAEKGPELAIDKKGNAKVYEKHTLAYLTKGTKIYPAEATKHILNAAEQERSSLLRSFNSNITISAPDHNAELKEQTKLLKSIDSKPVKFTIYNEPGIETSAWYKQHFKS